MNAQFCVRAASPCVARSPDLLVSLGLPLCEVGHWSLLWARSDSSFVNCGTAHRGDRGHRGWELGFILSSACGSLYVMSGNTPGLSFLIFNINIIFLN